jgi:hypothetical protein
MRKKIKVLMVAARVAGNANEAMVTPMASFAESAFGWSLE